MSDFVRIASLKSATAMLAVLVGLPLAMVCAPAQAHPLAGQAAPIDPADVAFWQTIQNSKNPAEYQAYLNAFPSGVFAELARLRIQENGGAASTTTTSTTVTTSTPAGAPALGPVVGKGIITATPSAIDVGEKVAFTFSKFPKPGSYDWIVVVPAGTPDSTSLTASVGGNYISLIPPDVPYQLGPFPPGLYEVRWLTTLYNVKGTLQVGARTQFTVNP